jgi:hypothetical protein
MKRLPLVTASVILSSVLLLSPALEARSARAKAEAARTPRAADIWRSVPSLWTSLVSIWQREGSSLDPFGNHGTAATPPPAGSGGEGQGAAPPLDR